jgi:hypothetical protein
VSEVVQDVELVHALGAEEVDGLRPLRLVHRGEHLGRVDFPLPGALRVQLGVLHDALEHGREHRLDVFVLGQGLELLVHEIVELLLQQFHVPAASGDDVRHLAVVEEREEEVLERDVLMPAPHGVGEGEFEGLLELPGDHVFSEFRVRRAGWHEA